jgi:hypothetical protein
VTTEHFFFRTPDAAQHGCCEPGSTLLCMGLFSRFFVQVLPCIGTHAPSAVRLHRSCHNPSYPRGPLAVGDQSLSYSQWTCNALTPEVAGLVLYAGAIP